mmetsp:Transcript_36975/g.45132  ORF Transcript_36975/g.45132 Transcript_36975/m.45132 type:complete len:149 (+) Transcript_36975:40-486(+)
MELTMNQLFLTTDPDSFVPPEIMTSVYLYDVDDFREFGLRTVHNYYNLTDTEFNQNLQYMKPVKDDDGDALPILGYQFNVDGSIGKEWSITSTDDTFPFNESNEQIKNWVRASKSMSLNFNIRQYINPDSPAQGTCYEEKVTQNYDFD